MLWFQSPEVQNLWLDMKTLLKQAEVEACVAGEGLKRLHGWAFVIYRDEGKMYLAPTILGEQRK